jgi:hypothetical protein
MRSSGLRLAIIFLLVLVPVISPQLAYGQTTSRVTLVRTATGYNPQTGAFTLGEQAYMGGNMGRLCIAYDYFQFNVTSGQVVHGQLNSPGQNIYYAILTSSQYRTFDSNAQNCIMMLGSAQAQVFNSQTTLNWTAPEAGQYALVFFTQTYYTGPVYFTVT